MIESLHNLISKRGFDDFLPGLIARFRANKLVHTIHYGEPPSSSLFVRLESKDRIGEICVWESGDCDISLLEHKKEKIIDEHCQLKSDQDFHSRLANVSFFVINREVKN